MVDRREWETDSQLVSTSSIIQVTLRKEIRVFTDRSIDRLQRSDEMKQSAWLQPTGAQWSRCFFNIWNTSAGTVRMYLPPSTCECLKHQKQLRSEVTCFFCVTVLWKCKSCRNVRMYFLLLVHVVVSSDVSVVQLIYIWNQEKKNQGILFLRLL